MPPLRSKSIRLRTKAPIRRSTEFLLDLRLYGNVSLPDRFELFELVREDPACQTFRARERATGRAVEAHLFLPSSGLASRFEHLSEQQSKTVLDRGSHEGKTYVVTTPLAGGFMEWLHAEPQDLASAGAWRIQPTAPTEPPPASPPASTPGAVPGDFTRMFQLRQAPEPVAATEPKPEPDLASPSQPGEFTRAFQKPIVAPPEPAAGSALAGQPGEFTRMFQPPVPAPASPASQTGEAESGRRGRISPRYVVIAVALLLAIAVFVAMRTLY